MESSKKRNIKPFDGDRYSVWKFRMRALLTELDIIKVIDEPRPSSPVLQTMEWQKSCRLAKSVMVEHLSDSFLSFAKEDTSAKEIFEKLDALYERRSVATQLALRKKLLSLKLKGDTPLIRHFTLFDDLVTELLAAGAKMEETDKISHLFLTLPSSYDGVITAIETLSEDNLTIAFVKNRLLDHEVKLKNENNDTSTKVLYVEHGKPQRKWNESYKNETKRNNHKFKPKKKTTVKCHHCGRKGHIKNDCYYYKRTQQNKGHDKPRTVQTIQTIDSTNEFQGFAFMTGANEYLDNDQSIIFLLDSGASDHIVNREDLFSDCKILDKPIKISVAKNDHFISAYKKGTLHVKSDTGVTGTLENVLYCPDVPYNLMSVSKMQKAGMTVTFNSQGVSISKDGNVVITGVQPADALTKPLSSPLFVRLRKDIGLE